MRNAVVPLPILEQHGRLTRIGETHCSCCHPERETSLLLGKCTHVLYMYKCG